VALHLVEDPVVKLALLRLAPIFKCVIDERLQFADFAQVGLNFFAYESDVSLLDEHLA
jgi:hypothetical protein